MSFPRRDELSKLSIRGLVAFSYRCALRMHSPCSHRCPKCKLLEVIKEYLQGDWGGEPGITPIPGEDRHKMFERFVARSGLADSMTTLPTSDKTLLYTAFATAQALRAEEKTSDSELLESAESIANDAYIAMEFVNHLGFDSGPVRRDFNDLLRQTSGQAWMIGDPIDMSKFSEIEYEE